jgi:hypothetical protein
MSDQPEPTSPPTRDWETDARFPSGPWVGYFLQPTVREGKNWMEVTLTFRGGTLDGVGRDWVGQFIVRGTYDVENGKVRFRKVYIGKHLVGYEGVADPKGIWGTWELPQFAMKGGFHLWPKGQGQAEGDTLHAAEEEPVRVSLGSLAEESCLPASG